jgi:hypothetical protein
MKLEKIAFEITVSKSIDQYGNKNLVNFGYEN